MKVKPLSPMPVDENSPFIDSSKAFTVLEG